jgi:hypothetical protein
MHRRSFLAGLASASLLAVSRTGGDTPTAPSSSPASPEGFAAAALGTTLALGLAHAPFAGRGYRDDTVHVFVPAHYRYRAGEGVAALVHFHGHYTSAERAMAAHELREQLAESRHNALLVVPQLAVTAADSSCGNLEAPGGLAQLLSEAVAAAAREGGATLGDARFPPDAPLGTVRLSAHGGGYHAAACALRDGGVDVRETYLFDALYGDLDTFRDWVVARAGQPPHRRRRLVSYSSVPGDTDARHTDLRERLERAGVDVPGDAVFVRTPRRLAVEWPFERRTKCRTDTASSSC